MGVKCLLLWYHRVCLIHVSLKNNFSSFYRALNLIPLHPVPTPSFRMSPVCRSTALISSRTYTSNLKQEAKHSSIPSLYFNRYHTSFLTSVHFRNPVTSGGPHPLYRVWFYLFYPCGQSYTSPVLTLKSQSGRKLGRRSKFVQWNRRDSE